jgi:hypothetical protein
MIPRMGTVITAIVIGGEKSQRFNKAGSPKMKKAKRITRPHPIAANIWGDPLDNDL